MPPTGSSDGVLPALHHVVPMAQAPQEQAADQLLRRGLVGDGVHPYSARCTDAALATHQHRVIDKRAIPAQLIETVAVAIGVAAEQPDKPREHHQFVDGGGWGRPGSIHFISLSRGVRTLSRAAWAGAM